MPTTVRPSGITVDTRGGTAVGPSPALRRRVDQPADAAPAPAGRRRTAAAAAAPLTEQEAIVNALEQQQLDLVDAIPIEPTPGGLGGSTRRRRRQGEPPIATGFAEQIDLSVPVGPDESAVVLIERDGVYEWHIAGIEGPAPLAPAGNTRRRRRAPAAGAPTAEPARTVRFTITVPPAEAPPAAAGARRRSTRRGGLVTTIVSGEVIAYVFRFAARPMLGGATRFLERNVREGLVHITAPDPQTWAAVPDEATLPLPTGRAARVLLLVHGTFSSTVGSFGALAGQPDGRAFLERALRAYDLVIGWDHRTLSALPTDNAVDLAARLDRLGFTQPPEVDAIAFSRGGLVLRSLIEHVLPSSPQTLTMRRAVFVACANGGTELARPENWHTFVDRYTNLAAAGARVATLVPGFTSAAAILASSIRGVGVFVKVLASTAMAGDAVPGIAAMNPGGDFVREINGVQPGQPSPAETFYCAVTSNFDPDAARAKSDPAVMPPALLVKLADRAADTLYGKPNDLVVHVDAMTQIDEATGPYVRERLDFGVNGAVHHCSYFSQPRTATRLAAWLEVPSGDDAGATAARGTRRGPSASNARPRRTRAAAAATDVVPLRSTMGVDEALRRLEQSPASWIVVERALIDAGKPATFRYAYPMAQGRAWLGNFRTQPSATVHDAFELRESRRSGEAQAGEPASPVPLEAGQSPAILDYHQGSRYRTVVMDHGQPVGVLALPGDGSAERGRASATAGGELEGLAGVSPAAGAAPEQQAGARRRRFRGVAKATPPVPPPPSPPVPAGPGARPRGQAPTAGRASADVPCHFRAETDHEYVVQRIHTVVVTIAREMLDATAGRNSAGGSAKVKAAKPLIVECMPMLRVTMVDPDDASVRIPVPEPGAPAQLRFDLMAQEVGAAEVSVQIRQGPFTLVTLALSPAVVETRSTTRQPVTAEADLDALPAAFPRATDELRIIQMRPTGGATQYRYELRLPSKRVQKQFESALLDTDPAAYVAALHTRIEDRWAEYRSEKEAFARDLRAIGAEMFDALFPLELRQLLWQHRDAIGSVQVLSSEPFVPWELVHVRDPGARKAGVGAAFLGEFGVVRWLVSGYPPERLRVRAGRARYVVPEYPSPNELPGAADEIALVTERFGATAVDTEAEAIYRLVETPGQFDLLHIACHGLADAADIDSARLEMPGKRRSDNTMSEEHVLATTVAREADLVDGDAQPIVVLNACQSARGGYALKGIGGFAQAFIEGGAGVFIGSSWSVGDQPALSFIEEFYARFLSESTPEPLAQAAAAARRKAREDGDATWLAYVVYGHPRAVAQMS
jgi:hypothetical protein